MENLECSDKDLYGSSVVGYDPRTRQWTHAGEFQELSWNIYNLINTSNSVRIIRSFLSKLNRVTTGQDRPGVSWRFCHIHNSLMCDGCDRIPRRKRRRSRRRSRRRRKRSKRSEMRMFCYIHDSLMYSNYPDDIELTVLTSTLTHTLMSENPAETALHL